MRAIERDGLPLQVRMLSNVDLLGKLGCLDASPRQRGTGFAFCSRLMRSALGLSAQTSVAALCAGAVRSLVLKRDITSGGDGRPHAPVRRGQYSLGRHFCALSRTAHWHRGCEGSGSAGFEVMLREESEMLRPAGIQPRKSEGRRLRAWPT